LVEIAPVHSAPKALYLPPYVGFSIQEMPLVEFFCLLLLFILENYISLKSLGHKQAFAKSPRAFPKNFIWVERDDGAKCVNEIVHMLLIKVVSCNGVAHRILCHCLTITPSHRDHHLRVHLYRFVS
jgi:hypothetical protein